MATITYEMEAMIRGYHVYATVWDAQIEELYCARGMGRNDSSKWAIRIRKL